LIPSNKSTNEKRLSFKDGSTIEEVVRTYQSNQGPSHRRSLVPRHSVSMSPIKKEQLSDVKEGGISNTDTKTGHIEDSKATAIQLPLNLIN
jgi:hypothetical protein